MSQETAIEWTDLSWNPVHGCSKVSPGCAHCYAETLSLRYKHTLKPWTPANAAENVLLKPHKLREPLSNGKDWRGLGAAAARAGKTDGKLVFVNSTSDLFHDQVPDHFIARVFGVMRDAPRHTFQVLTKRPERMRDLLLDPGFAMQVGLESNTGPGTLPIDWPLPNVWLGVSIENRRYVSRAHHLRQTPAAKRFISAEPLLGPLIGPDRVNVMCHAGVVEVKGWATGPTTYLPSLDLTDIDWLIVGGESGPGHRPMRREWIEDLHEAAWSGPPENRTAFLFKQWGGATAKAGGRELDGRTWDEFPQVTEPAGLPV